MDMLTGLLDGPKARGAYLLKSVLNPPWSLRVEDRAPLSVIALVRGSGWLLPDGGEPARIGPGDVAVVRGPVPYAFADSPDARGRGSRSARTSGAVRRRARTSPTPCHWGCGPGAPTTRSRGRRWC